MRVLGSAILAAMLSLGTTSAQAEGFFEAIGNALFGHHQPDNGPQGEIGAGPLHMRVRPHRDRVGRGSLRRGHRRAVAAVPKAPLVKIDPDKEPTWYLGDPTLRRGDIIVVKGGVIVFDGAASAQHATDEFVKLSETRLVSERVRQEIADAAAGWTMPPPAATKSASKAHGRAHATPRSARR